MRLATLLRFGLELALTFFAPAKCAACACRVPMRRVFCPACAATVVARKPPGPREVAPFVYGGAIARALVRLKYDPEPSLARPLGELLRGSLAALGSFAPDAVVPVPLHATRLAERGFNQAALLAAPIAKDLGAPLLARALVRTRNTPQQALLDRRARLTNVTSAFLARDPSLVRGRSVLLVDDVRTTGATLRACEEALRAAGARDVRFLVLARAEG